MKNRSILVDGRGIAKALEEKLATELLFSTPKKVCFVVFGKDNATEQFVKMKSQVALRVGVSVEVERPSDIKTTADAIAIVRQANSEEYDGIVVQLPLPTQINTQAVLDEVSPLRDIDVLGTIAKESYAKGKINRTPPVAQAVYEILNFHDIKLTDKKVVIVGRGRLVGEPVSLMLKRMKVPFVVIDIDTDKKERAALLKDADVIISGIGVPHSIKPDMIKEGVILIDAGTSEQAGKLVGDFDPVCIKKASLVTPVPGGVGPITVVSLFRNLL